MVFETAADGRRNWDFGGAASATVGARIDRLVFENSRLIYRPAASAERRLAVANLELLGLGGNEPSVTAELDYHDIPIAASARTDADTPGGQAARTFSGRVSSADMAADFRGRLIRPGDALEVELTVQGDTPNLPEALRVALSHAADIGPRNCS